MADVSLYLPDPEQSRIKRGRSMAALLQQQAQAPIETSSYNGIQAPISPLSGLAKVLSGFGSAYLERDAEKQETGLRDKYSSDAQKWAQALQGTMQPGTPAPTAQTADVQDRDQGIAMGSGAQPLTQGQEIGPAGPSTMVSPSPDQLRTLAAQGMGSMNPMIRAMAPSALATANTRDQQAFQMQRDQVQNNYQTARDTLSQAHQDLMQNNTFENQQKVQAATQAFQDAQRKATEAFQSTQKQPVMVPDASSPTGFKFVTPEQAVGQPAYNDKALFGVPGSPGSVGGPAVPGTPQVTGDDFLKTLSPQIGDTVKGMAEGRIPISPQMVRTPQGIQLLGLVSQYDPSFDAVNYNARNRAYTDATSGKTAGQINAMNTVLGHLSSLSDAADALKNGNYPILNTIGNAANTATGDPRQKNFDTTRKAVVDELTRVWRGNGGSEGDIKTWSDAINASDSPEQLHSTIGQIGELLQSKIGAFGDQFRQSLGPGAKGIRLLTPESQATLDKLETRAGKRGAGDGGPAPAGVDPKLWAHMTAQERALFK